MLHRVLLDLVFSNSLRRTAPRSCPARLSYEGGGCLACPRSRRSQISMLIVQCHVQGLAQPGRQWRAGPCLTAPELFIWNDRNVCLKPAPLYITWGWRANGRVSQQDILTMLWNDERSSVSEGIDLASYRSRPSRAQLRSRGRRRWIEGPNEDFQLVLLRREGSFCEADTLLTADALVAIARVFRTYSL